MKLDDDFSTTDIDYSEETLKVMKQGCLSEMRTNPDVKDILTDKMMIELCDCMMERLAHRDIKMSELRKFDNTDTEAYNEIGMACFEELITEYKLSEPKASPMIIGESDKTVMPLVYISGQGYKVKIQIGSLKRYLLIDTGASDFVITDELASELMSEGVISEYDLLSEDQRILADGKTIDVKRVRIGEILIGDFKVLNIEASIVDGGTPLCGMELLNVFSNWELVPRSKELRFYK